MYISIDTDINLISWIDKWALTRKKSFKGMEEAGNRKKILTVIKLK